jgi:2,4-dienoyl-CoA reductase-like NADH-dependent reductase (Old Yellow Enzyme family)
VILIGGNHDFNAMTKLLNETSVGYFGICRPLITEPGIINRWAGGDTSRSRCICCYKCIDSGKEAWCILDRR